MKKTDRSILIILGYTAAIAAAVIAAADFLLEFNPQYGVASTIIEPAWEHMAPWRFSLSFNLCAFFIPLYIPGFYVLYQILKKPYPAAAALVCLTFCYGVIMGSPLIHGIMSINPLIYQTGLAHGMSSSLQQTLIVDTVTRAVLPVFLVHYLITWIIAPTVLFILIIRGNTILPRWSALLNPLVFMILGLIGQWLLPDIGIYFSPGSINKGNAALFFIATFYYQKEYSAAAAPV